MLSDSQNLGSAADSNMTLAAPPQSARSTVLAFGDYDVVGELGEGGMGRVYKAVDRNLGRHVAVKVLRSTDPAECGRFRGEAGLIATLEHPNIVQIFAVDVTPDGRPYLVLELAEGGSLDRELDGRPLEPRRAAEMMETVARAVQFAHDKGVIHRDLKPANILRSKDRTLKLTDFGLAKDMKVASGMTPSNAVMGTPSYMSPEQAEGKVKAVGPPADVYGLGAILYEMLTGVPPFRGVNVVETLEQVRWAEPVPPTRLAMRLPRDLSTICLKCLQKSPARRYQTAGELADDLRAFLDGRTIAARPAPGWERLLRQVKRRPWEAAAVTTSVLLVVLLIVGWVFLQRKGHEEQVAREKAAAERQVQAEREKGEQERDAERKRNEDRIKKQAGDSLAALNDIRTLVLEGELSRVPKLDPLYESLSRFYDTLIARDDAGFDKVELADGLVKVGDLFARAGKKDRALEAYRRAADRSRPLADPRARGVLAAALLKGGQAAFDLGDDAAAEAAAAEVEGLLAGFAPPPGPLAGEAAAAAGHVAEGHHLRGQVLAKRNAFPAAEGSFRRALELRERLAADAPPGDRKRHLAALSDVGRGYGYLGGALLDDNRIAAAEDAYWRSHYTRRRVAEAYPPDDKSGEALDARFQLSRSWANLAALHTRSRTLGTARHFAQEAVDAATRLAADDARAEYRQEACHRLVQLAELDMLIWLRPGVTADAARRAEIAAGLEKAKGYVPEDAAAKDDPTKDKRGRRERGLYATAQVLAAVLTVDADPDRARNTLMDAFRQLTPLTDPAKGPVDPAHLYYRAVGRIMFVELNATSTTPAALQERLDALRAAVEQSGGARRRHPDDLEQFRAFKPVKDHPAFRKLMAELRAKADGKPAPARP